MRYKVTYEIAAPAHRVWDVLTDVANWPSWTSTVTAVELLGAEKLAAGVQVRVKQPGRRPTVYTVEQLAESRQFRWSRTGAGVHQWADHVVKPQGLDKATIALEFGMDGPVGRVLGWLGINKIRKFVELEGTSLRERVEGASS